jgi:hypothetical protein
MVPRHRDRPPGRHGEKLTVLYYEATHTSYDRVIELEIGFRPRTRVLEIAYDVL